MPWTCFDCSIIITYFSKQVVEHTTQTKWKQLHKIVTKLTSFSSFETFSKSASWSFLCITASSSNPISRNFNQSSAFPDSNPAASTTSPRASLRDPNGGGGGSLGTMTDLPFAEGVRLELVGAPTRRVVKADAPAVGHAFFCGGNIAPSMYWNNAGKVAF